MDAIDPQINRSDKSRIGRAGKAIGQKEKDMTAQERTAALAKMSPADKLKFYEKENEEMRAQLATASIPGKVKLVVTAARLPGTNGVNDKGTTSTGAISMYNIQRFPITLRRKQWIRVREVLTDPAQFDAFVKANESKLVDEKPAATDAAA